MFEYVFNAGDRVITGVPAQKAKEESATGNDDMMSLLNEINLKLDLSLKAIGVSQKEIREAEIEAEQQ